MNVKVREACLADIEQITAIYNDAVLHTVATFDTETKSVSDRLRWFKQHTAPYAVLVAETAKQVVGWACLSPHSERNAYRFTAEDSVYVHKDFRGHGIGDALLREIVIVAQKHHLRTVLAKIAGENAASIRLHERNGFAVAGTLREVGWKMGRWLDVTIMQRML